MDTASSAEHLSEGLSRMAPPPEDVCVGDTLPPATLRRMVEQGLTRALAEEITAALLLRIAADSSDMAAIFTLGYIKFLTNRMDDAKSLFESIKESETKAGFMLTIMQYDGLGGFPSDPANERAAVEAMMEIARQQSRKLEPFVYAARYNIGLAYLIGFGVKRDDGETETWWLAAADDGNPEASVKAQTALGMFYSRPETRNLEKAFYWHSEATGNGSLESQGAMGIMYDKGLGVERNKKAAFECYLAAAERGNIYAVGLIVAYYFRNKMYTRTVEWAARALQQEDLDINCLPGTTKRGLALAYFYLARCFQLGKAVKQDLEKAKEYFSISFQHDGDMAAQLHHQIRTADV